MPIVGISLSVNDPLVNKSQPLCQLIYRSPSEERPSQCNIWRRSWNQCWLSSSQSQAFYIPCFKMCHSKGLITSDTQARQIKSWETLMLIWWDITEVLNWIETNQFYVEARRAVSFNLYCNACSFNYQIGYRTKVNFDWWIYVSNLDVHYFDVISVSESRYHRKSHQRQSYIWNVNKPP